MKSLASPLGAALLVAGAGLLAAAVPAHAQYRDVIGNDMSRCKGGEPAMLVTIDGVKSSAGRVRVQSYRASEADWLKKGRWINRIEAPARAGTMTFCVPVPASGTYGIAVRHDVDGDGDTDLTSDGGGMSNNPSINIFNLGKPSYRKVGVAVGSGVKPVRIHIRYM
jgi:uncharacterized protein (DUF2141 family)